MFDIKPKEISGIMNCHISVDSIHVKTKTHSNSEAWAGLGMTTM